jgi:hypothetical protein
MNRQNSLAKNCRGEMNATVLVGDLGLKEPGRLTSGLMKAQWL